MRLISTTQSQEIGDLDRLYKKAVATRGPNDIQTFMDLFHSIFYPGNVLRFLHTSTFFGEPVSNVLHVQPSVVSGKTPLINRNQVQTLASKAEYRAAPIGPPAQGLGHNSAVRLVRDALYFVSVFPAAAALINEGKIQVDDAFMREEIVKLADRSAVGTIAMVAQYWKRVTETAKNPKIAAIVREIVHMFNSDRPTVSSAPASKRAPRARQQEAIRLNRMVIVTPTVATALFLYMYLSQEKFRALHGPGPVLIHQDLSLGDRDTIIRRFSSETNSYHSVLIGTFDTLGTGTNLQRANYQILTSPLPRTTDVAQAFGRTNRTGQTLPVVHKILVLEDNPVDRANMCLIAQRDIKSNTYRMSEKLELH
ncbi:unnamed protein product [Discula destructiva]